MLELKRFYDSNKRTSNYHIIDNQNNLTLKLTYGSNGDLYWAVHSLNDSEKVIKFNINCNEDLKLYEIMDDISKLIFGAMDKKTIATSNKQFERYESVNPLTKVIKWISDDKKGDDANSVKMYKQDTNYVLEFTKNDLSSYEHSVRFSSSSTRYERFHIPFMYAYRQLDRAYANYGQIATSNQNGKPKSLIKGI